ELELQKRRAEQGAIEAQKGDNGWGNQIRSYVLQPYTLVKDHRTGAENTNALGVLDGNIDPFINAYLKSIANGSFKGEK
ncbi:MAG: peptide chain release factor 2, partial [Lachnospiraceae bacterium]|nr:peptide chain release factor 2 [Lachnospiraceae bacterium]